ncbi:MAG TPA: aminodeoxychorismate lyase [Gallionella sp.]|nr:aminodeoxychorismate lyase [Gallionella sp.]
MLVNGAPSKLISIRDRGLLYGDGVFRTLRASNGEALHWPQHYQKLQHDCSALGIACPDNALLSAELSDILEKHPDGVVKLIITRGPGVRGYAPPAEAMPTRIWDVAPRPPYPVDWSTRGIRARICKLRLSHQPRLAGIKHLNRLENVLAAAEWNDADIAEGLLLDEAGNVIEGTRSNLFLMTQGRLVTPYLTQCGVAGVQRERVIAWAEQHGMPLQVRAVSLDEVMFADELFLVNSVIGLWPIRELEQRRWNEFLVAAKIRQSLFSQD